MFPPRLHQPLIDRIEAIVQQTNISRQEAERRLRQPLAKCMERCDAGWQQRHRNM